LHRAAADWDGGSRCPTLKPRPSAAMSGPGTFPTCAGGRRKQQGSIQALLFMSEPPLPAPTLLAHVRLECRTGIHFFLSQPERPKPVGGYHCPRDAGLVPKGEIPHEHGR